MPAHTPGSLPEVLDDDALVQLQTGQVDRIEFWYGGYDVTVRRDGAVEMRRGD